MVVVVMARAVNKAAVVTGQDVQSVQEGQDGQGVRVVGEATG